MYAYVHWCPCMLGFHSLLQDIIILNALINMHALFSSQLQKHHLGGYSVDTFSFQVMLWVTVPLVVPASSMTDVIIRPTATVSKQLYSKVDIWSAIAIFSIIIYQLPVDCKIYLTSYLYKAMTDNTRACTYTSTSIIYNYYQLLFMTLYVHMTYGLSYWLLCLWLTLNVECARLHEQL